MAEYADQLMTELKTAMKAKDSKRRDVIRQLQAAFKQVAIDEQKDLTTEDELSILEKEAKKRRETIAELEEADRDIKDEQYELDLIVSFMPEQLSEDEIRNLAQSAIDETGASEPKDMGKVMGKLVPQTKGRADGKLVSQIVRNLLTS